MRPKYCFRKPFKLPYQIERIDLLPHPYRQIWSRPNKAQELVFREEEEKKTLISLGTHSTVFQAELTSIVHCTKELLNQETNNRTLVTCSDSQAVLKALRSSQVKSKLLQDCLEALKQIISRNKVTLSWLLGHKGYEHNEESNKLAREGSSKALLGSEPFWWITRSTIR